MEENIYAQRLKELRAVMKEHGVTALLIPTADAHGSEYVADYYKAREHFSGFTGSAGTLAVTLYEAALWTDGRYFIQARAELEGSGVVLQRSGEPGVPGIHEFLKDRLSSGGTLAFDGACIARSEGEALEKDLAPCGVKLVWDIDLAGLAWKDRPPLSSSPVRILDEQYAGESTEKKLERLRARMASEGAKYYITEKLDEIMWLFNIRGADVECNPVALSYAFISEEEQYIFLRKKALTAEFSGYAAARDIQIREYETFHEFISTRTYGGKILLDPDKISYKTFMNLRAAFSECHVRITDQLVQTFSPVEYMKSIKNEAEIRNFRDIYIEDSAVLTKFIYYIKKLSRTNPDRDTVTFPDGSPVTEGAAAAYLDGLRSKVRDYVELSFPTISAYGPNAAMMHYEPDEKGGAVLKKEGMLLVDSGGHYLRGTTDVTRTISLGPATKEMIRDYSLTAVSVFQLQECVFMEGCSGIALDILAREPMWKNGMDYKCGTGHGIGYLLNVHEGPQTIRFRKRAAADMTPFAEGMVVSDEPGVYKDGRYGIRIETILLTVHNKTTPDGKFLSFEPLTYVPLDRDLIDPSILTQETRQALNVYHARTLEVLLPFMNEEEGEWLKEQCREI